MKIFLSYGHDSNAELVELIKKELETLHPDYEIWFDKKNIHAGDDWRRSIYTGISESNTVLACLSRHSVREPGVCLDELRIAAGERTCEIASILLESPEDVTPPLSISHIQYLDLSSWKEKRSQGENIFKPWFTEQVQLIDKMLGKGEQFTGEVEQLKKMLIPRNLAGSYLDRMQALLKDGFVGREWLFKEIQDWLDNDKHRKAFCITGEPGIGKSALVAQFASQNKIQVVGIHFCTSGSTLDTPRNVILSLAFQMGTRLPAYRKYLLNHDLGLEELADVDLFSKLITEAGSFGIDGGHQPCLLVIDGLDEANGELASFIAQHYRELPEWLYFLVTSRPNEKHVKAHLKAMNPRVLAADDKQNEADARLFIQKWLDSVAVESSMKNRLAERLYQISAGNFRYLSFLRDMVKSGTTSFEEILEGDNFPHELSTLYQSFMERMFPDEDSFAKAARPVLSMLSCCGAMPLDFGTISAVAKKQYGLGEAAVKEVIVKLGSLVRCNEHRIPQKATVQFYHKSVPDWLASDANSQYILEANEASTHLIRHLWDLMSKAVNKEKLKDEFRDQYAALLGQLLLDKLCPGEGITPKRLDDFDATALEELGITEKNWDQCTALVYEYTSSETEDWQHYQDIFRSWSIVAYLVEFELHGYKSEDTIPYSGELLDVFPVGQHSEWATVFAEKQYESVIEECGLQSQQRFQALDVLRRVYNEHPDPEYDGKSMEILETALPDAKKVFGTKSAEIAGIYLEYANCYSSTPDEDLEEYDFEKYFKKAIKIHRAHYDSWWASLSANEQKFFKQIMSGKLPYDKLSEKQKTDLKKAFEEEDSAMNLSVALRDYAGFLNNIEEYEQANEHITESLCLWRLEEEMPSSAHNGVLSDTLIGLERYDEAISVSQASVDMAIAMYGPVHSCTAAELSELSATYERIYDNTEDAKFLEKAIEVLKQSISITETFGYEDDHLIHNKTDLAQLYYKAERFEEALEEAQSACDISLNNLGLSAYIAQPWEILADCKLALDEHNFDLVSEMSGLFAKMEDFWGRYDAHLGVMYNQLLEHFGFANTTDNFVKIYEDYCDINKNLSGEKSWIFLDALSGYAWQFYLHENNPKQALKLLDKAEKLIDSVGSEYDWLINQLCRVCVLAQLGDHAECVRVYKKVAKDAFDEDAELPSLPLRMAAENAGDAYTALGKMKDAQKCLQQAKGVAEYEEDEDTMAHLDKKMKKLKSK